MALDEPGRQVSGCPPPEPPAEDQADYRDGAPQDYDEAEAKACLAPAEVLVRIDLGQGTGEATAWGSDLTEEFVRLNSMYTT